MNKSFLMYVVLTLFIAGSIHAQGRKIDTTLKMSQVGYRVQCSNKDSNENSISITPVGFKVDARNVDFPIKGIVKKAMIDDLNSDGYPDLVLCIYGGANGDIGTIVGISSAENKSLVPIYFPDIYIDPKIRDGYKGHDEFSLVIGTLMRKFPLYLPGDASDKPTGGKRSVQYQVTSDQGRLQFKLLRTYDTKPE